MTTSLMSSVGSRHAAGAGIATRWRKTSLVMQLVAWICLWSSVGLVRAEAVTSELEAVIVAQLEPLSSEAIVKKKEPQIMYSAKSVYPWTETREYRRSQILKSLRANRELEIGSSATMEAFLKSRYSFNPSLVSSTILSAASKEQEQVSSVGETDSKEHVISDEKEMTLHAMHLRDVNGTSFLIHQAIPKIPITPRSIHNLTSLKEVIGKQSSCTTLSLGWWTYEWCLNGSIRQYHLDQEALVAGKRLITAEISLGNFATHKERKNFHTKPPLLSSVEEIHINGNWCDEIKASRSAKVVVRCCDAENFPFVANSVEYYKAIMSGKKPRSRLFHLASVSETSTCRYQLLVCSPLLCAPPSPQIDASSSSSTLGNVQLPEKAIEIATKRESSLETLYQQGDLLAFKQKEEELMMDFFSQLKDLCVVRKEDWWTYEVCPLTSVRQMRLTSEHSVNSDGGSVHRQVISAQFDLGKAIPIEQINGTYLLSQTAFKTLRGSINSDFEEQNIGIFEKMGMVSSLFRLDQPQMNSLRLSYRDGTECDLDNIRRMTTVEMTCGVSDSVVSVREVSTCQYGIIVQLKALCTLPSFVLKSRNSTRLVISPLYAQDEELVNDSEEEDLPDSSSDNLDKSAGTTHEKPVNVVSAAVPPAIEVVPEKFTVVSTPVTEEAVEKLTTDDVAVPPDVEMVPEKVTVVSTPVTEEAVEKLTTDDVAVPPAIEVVPEKFTVVSTPVTEEAVEKLTTDDVAVPPAIEVVPEKISTDASVPEATSETDVTIEELLADDVVVPSTADLAVDAAVIETETTQVVDPVTETLSTDAIVPPVAVAELQMETTNSVTDEEVKNQHTDSSIVPSANVVQDADVVKETIIPETCSASDEGNCHTDSDEL